MIAMKTSSLTRLVLVALLASGCAKIEPLSSPAAVGGSADFGTYVALGTSITAGYQSGGVANQHQMTSYAASFARQTGKPVLASGTGSFTYPAIGADGIPPLLRLVSLSPLQISNAGRTLGSPLNLGQVGAYHNYGVPGALLLDLADETHYYATVPPVNRTTFTFFDLIARHSGTLLAQAASLGPTFITFEYGANEVLGPATSGSGVAALTGPQFAALLNGTLDALEAAAPGVKLALFNVPDVTTIPFVTTFPPVVLDANGNPVIVNGNPLTLVGPGGTPLGLGDYVLLTAQADLAAGNGFPTGTFSYLTGAAGTNQPLTDAEVLSAGEAASIRSAVDQYNAAIASEAAARGAALVDLRGLLQRAATTGIPFQGTEYTSEFITGGLFSLDGVHPNDLAHGILCNVLIDAVNATFGARVPHVDLRGLATATSSRARPAAAGGRARPRIEGLGDGLAALFPWRGEPAP